MESPRPDALIETIHVAPDGSIALWKEHARRLRRSAQTLGFAPIRDDIEAQVHSAASESLVSDTGRRLRLLYRHDGTISIETSPLPPLPDRPGVAWANVCLASPSSGMLDSTEPLLRHKTTYRPWYASATSWLARHPNVFDLLYVNESGEVCEGSRTNVYARLGGVWLTPPINVGCLPGAVRASLLARRLVRCARLTPADVNQAEALRLSNGLRGWFDVVLQDQHGRPLRSGHAHRGSHSDH